MNERGLGKKQSQTLEFIRRVNGWHSYAPDVENVIRSLSERGLVEYSYNTRQFRAIHTLRCDQCQMLSINGVACHETGCPNSRKTWDAERGEWIRFVECRECGCNVEEGTYCGCCPETGGDYEEPMAESEEA